MGTRAFDASLVGIILITPIFLGSIFLLIDIPIFNPVNQLSIVAAVLGLGLGLVFGLFAGRWYTREQLRILIVNNEFRGLGSKKLNVAVFAGLAIFLFYSFFTLVFDIIVLGNALVLFVISAIFIGFLARMLLIKSWERREERIVLMEWNKFYVIPQHPPQY